MKLQRFNKIFDYIFFISTCVFIALGCLGIFETAVIVYGTLNAILALGYKLIKTRSIELPQNFGLYLILVLIILIHTYLLHGAYLFSWLFLSGGLYWLMVYNFNDLYAKNLTFILVTIGLLMGIIYFYSLANPISVPNLSSLFAAPTNFLKHSNLGDLWAVVLVSLSPVIISRRISTLIPIYVIGIYFMIISYSRTALVGLTVGTFYTVLQLKTNYKKTIILILLTIMSLLFVYISLSKTTIFDRPYFWQAIVGLTKYPVGVGMGNFNKVSTLTNYVHDLPLEMVSGLGLFSIIFLAWLYGVLRRIFQKKNQINVEATGVFLTIFTVFLFDTTYTIPGMIWMLFTSLALSEAKNPY